MFWRRRRSEDDISAEIRAHLDLEADDLVAEGLPEQQARATARQEFGSVALTRQRLYEKGRVLWLDDLVRDLRHSIAMYRRAPGFTIAVVVTLALGIGLNTAIFSFVNALLLKPLPVPNSDRLVAIHTSDFSGPAHGSTGYPDYVDFRDSSRDVLTGLAAYSMELMNFSDGAGSDRVQGHVVTQNYFSVVGVDVARGRVFGPDDEDVVVVSHGLWQRMLGGREDVLGRRITINGKPSLVIGVAPAGFTGLLQRVACRSLAAARAPAATRTAIDRAWLALAHGRGPACGRRGTAAGAGRVHGDRRPVAPSLSAGVE